MDIKQIVKDYRNASEQDRKTIEENIERDFALLPESEKEEVRRIFLEDMDVAIGEAKYALKELDLYTELERVSKFVSMSYIARNFFGKSRQWLNNRIKGNSVNGKPAVFTSDELNRFSNALNQLGEEIKDTALRIAR
ncbi:MAG: DUF5053 domain-containing protein [Tannerella sp.]|jgi:hypothetical protein|nr:DUF5053 domain-containing protein [Tannerella sp.]